MGQLECLVVQLPHQHLHLLGAGLGFGFGGGSPHFNRGERRPELVARRAGSVEVGGQLVGRAPELGALLSQRIALHPRRPRRLELGCEHAGLLGRVGVGGGEPARIVEPVLKQLDGVVCVDQILLTLLDLVVLLMHRLLEPHHLRV